MSAFVAFIAHPEREARIDNVIPSFVYIGIL
jgi:hypothetical protein